MAERRPDHDHPNKSSPSGLTATHGAQRQAAQPQSQSASNPTRLSSEDFGNTVVEASAHLRHLAEKTLLPSLNPLRTSTTPPKRPVVNQTLHACEFCRKSKTRCSGGQLCERCRTYGNQCIYRDGKRDKEKKQKRERETRDYESTRQRNEVLERMLHQISISPRLDSSEKGRIQGILAQSPSVCFNKLEIDTGGSPEQSKSQIVPEPDGETLASGDVGSTESLDIIHEDVDHDEGSRATGFLGKGSEITWMQRAKKQATKNLAGTTQSDASSSGDDISLAQASYHINNADTATIDKSQVNPFEWPTPSVALAYVTSYFNTIHSAFPIVHKNGFMAVFNQFPRHNINNLSSINQRWLSQINLVFAISAKFAHLTKADYRGNEYDHLIFYARAKALGLEYQKLTDRPEIDQLSCVGLLGLYLIVDHQISSAWTVIGLSVRHATALGLHLRSGVKDISDLDKELRVRVWWSLYSLERLLGEYTGRPSCISDYDISTPLPLNLDEVELQQGFLTEEKRYPGANHSNFLALIALDLASEIHLDPSQFSGGSAASMNPLSVVGRLPVTTSTYFIHRTLLSMITHEVLTRIYCATTAKTKWIDVQNSIRRIDSKLLAWVRNLPSELDFLTQTERTEYKLERMGLGMHYSSARMILHRSCLCRFEGRIQHESKMSKDFNRLAAGTCVDSARDIIRYLPHSPDPPKAYSNTPWWSLLHYLCQAASVLILEIAFRAEHAPTAAEDILRDAKKIVIWLRAMSVESVAARKSWVIFDALLREAAPKIGGNTNDMPREPPMPSGWVNQLEQNDYQSYTSGPDQGLYSAAPESQPYFAHNAPVDAGADQGNSESWNFLPSTYGFPGNYPQDDQQFPQAPPFYTMYDEFGP